MRCAITEQEATTLQPALQAGPLVAEVCNLLDEFRRFNAEHCLCAEFGNMCRVSLYLRRNKNGYGVGRSLHPKCMTEGL